MPLAVTFTAGTTPFLSLKVNRMIAKFFLSLSKVVVGVSLAMIVLSLAGVATARYFMAKLAVLPEKPLYASETQTAEPIEVEENSAVPTEPEAVATPPVDSAPEAASEAALEPGQYKVLVVQPIGLVLREGPGQDYIQLGGVEYDDTLIVIGQNESQTWLNVRLSNGQEGWVKGGGNVQAAENNPAETEE
ncbi:MAG: SH3 domain-containing protein [Cyanobacteria bacterium P01_H01_bin.119]